MPAWVVQHTPVGMMNVDFFPRAQVLSPDDLRLAADAFDAALQSLPAQVNELAPYTARRLLARYVIEKALSGVLDPIRLRDEALAAVSLATHAGPRLQTQS